MERIGAIELTNLLACLVSWRAGECTDDDVRGVLDSLLETHCPELQHEFDISGSLATIRPQTIDPRRLAEQLVEAYRAASVASLDPEFNFEESSDSILQDQYTTHGSERITMSNVDNDSSDAASPSHASRSKPDAESAAPLLPETEFLAADHDFYEPRISIVHRLLTPYFFIDDTIRCSTLDYVSLPKIAAVVGLVAVSIFAVNSIPEDSDVYRWFDRTSAVAAKAENVANQESELADTDTDDSPTNRADDGGEGSSRRTAEDVASSNSAGMLPDSAATSKPSAFTEQVDGLDLADSDKIPSGLEVLAKSGTMADSMEQPSELEQQATQLIAQMEQTASAKLSEDELQRVLETRHNVPELELLRAELLLRQETSEGRLAAWRILIREADEAPAALCRMMLARLLLASPLEDREIMRGQFNTAIELFNPELAYLKHWLDVRKLGKDFDTAPIQRAIDEANEASFCDCIFLANAHFTARDVESALECMNEAQAALDTLKPTYPTQAENWLAESSAAELSSLVESTISKLTQIQSKIAETAPKIF